LDELLDDLGHRLVLGPGAEAERLIEIAG
jgi:hypothetical protein